MAKPAAVPRGLGPEGRRLWRAVVERWDLDPHEALLLRQVCRTADLCERLEAVVAAEAPSSSVASRHAVVELRPRGCAAAGACRVPGVAYLEGDRAASVVPDPAPAP
jgi:hypothetical protein